MRWRIFKYNLTQEINHIMKSCVYDVVFESICSSLTIKNRNDSGVNIAKKSYYYFHRKKSSLSLVVFVM